MVSPYVNQPLEEVWTFWFGDCDHTYGDFLTGAKRREWEWDDG